MKNTSRQIHVMLPNDAIIIFFAEQNCFTFVCTCNDILLQQINHCGTYPLMRLPKMKYKVVKLINDLNIFS